MNGAHPGGVRRWLKGLMLKRVHYMITCKEFEDFVLQYLDGELSDRQRSIFEWHIRLCRECREYLAAYRRTLEIAGAVLAPPDASIPEDVPEDLIVAILDAREN
jgi:anti-sigma factor RsiW